MVLPAPGSSASRNRSGCFGSISSYTAVIWCGSGITVEFTSYDAASGVLQFNATSNTVIDIPAYVRALQNCGVFSDVDYTGYQSTNGRGQPAGYALNLRCTLAAPE